MKTSPLEQTALRCLPALLCAALLLSIPPQQGCAEEDTPKQRQAQLHYMMGNRLVQEKRYKEAQEEYRLALNLIEEIDDLLELPYGSSLDPQTSVETDIQPAAAAPGTHAWSPVLSAPPPSSLPPLRPQTQEPAALSSGDAAFAPQAPPAPAAERRAATTTGIYLIDEGDVLQLSVWQNPDLEQEVIVRPDGKISCALIGDVDASGLTIPELDGAITERLKEYIRSPEVSLSLKKFSGKKVIVLGEVKEPGIYSVTGAKTILEAIGLAGGLTQDSVASSVIVISGGLSNPKPRRINLTKALHKGDMSNNPPLQAEDIIFVPKKFIADINYILMQVLEPLTKGALNVKELERIF